MVPWYWYRPTSLYVYLDMAQTWLRSTAGIWSTSFIEQLRNLVLALPISSKDGGVQNTQDPTWWDLATNAVGTYHPWGDLYPSDMGLGAPLFPIIRHQQCSGRRHRLIVRRQAKDTSCEEREENNITMYSSTTTTRVQHNCKRSITRLVRRERTA